MTDENAAEPVPGPPAELVGFLRRVEAAGEDVTEDLRAKARILLNSFESGQWPVIDSPGTSEAATHASAGSTSGRTIEVHLADYATVVDDLTVRVIPENVPPAVQRYLRRWAAAAPAIGGRALEGVLLHVILNAPEWIGWTGH